ncbi:MAG: CoB--CoM heterodisulfide reductase iron-sulfur subunit B family protein, partial [Candidatus Bathyarchaeia archaeon]
MKRYALFLGCTIPTRALNYEVSARKIAARLGVELIDLPFTCCGYPVEPVDRESAVLMAVRNLALAEELSLDIVTLCSACTGTLTRFSQLDGEEWKTEPSLLNRLESIGVKYKRSVKVRHYARMLLEDFGADKLKGLMTRSLEGLKVLAHYGCHYTRPSECYVGFDDPETPHTLDDLVEATGAISVDIPRKRECCGAALLAIDKSLALAMTERKLQAAKKAGIDALVVICPFCGIAYDR